MKKSIVLSLFALFVLQTLVPKTTVAQDKLSGRISLSGAFALYPLAVKWAEEFKKLHPNVKIDISAGGAGKGMTDALGGLVDIGMLSRDVANDETKKGAYSFAVAKDAVVAVVSAKNPALADIKAKGLKRDAGNNIWITGTYKKWSQAFGGKVAAPIHIYTRSDACGAAEIWSKFFGKKQEDLKGSGVFGDPGLALAVQKDPLGIGYNNIGYAYDHKTRKPNNGLVVVPIDVNNNGKIDPDENFYESLDDLMTAIANGKYPAPPSRSLYFVTKKKPTNPIVTEFIRWVLTDGQKYVKEAGYISFSKEKLDTEKKKL